MVFENSPGGKVNRFRTWASISSMISLASSARLDFPLLGVPVMARVVLSLHAFHASLAAFIMLAIDAVLNTYPETLLP